jgi:heat shock protein HtpX
MRRIVLFILTNILVMLTISIVASLVFNFLGLDPVSGTDGNLNHTSLLVLCSLWGMGGSFISLLMSKWSAKMLMRIKVIDPTTTDPHGAQLVRVVHKLAQAAHLPKMPEVGIYQSPEVNAFATGPSKSNSLVAVSSGLLNRMDNDSIEGVLGHEVAHIANGDMVTMTLIQGVVNSFVFFFAWLASIAISNLMRDDRGNGPGFFVEFLVRQVLIVLFSFMAAPLVMWVSRQREFKADRDSAKLGGREKMIAALTSLKATSQMVDGSHKSMATMKIAGNQGGLMRFWRSHPDLDERIQTLRQYA